MMKRAGRSWCVLSLLGAMVFFPLVVYAEPARWNVDPEHSTIEFRVAHMVVSKTSGRFTDYAGFIDMDAEAGTLTSIEATIKAGISAGVAQTLRARTTERWANQFCMGGSSRAANLAATTER